MFCPVPFAIPLAQAGKLRILGVTTAERLAILPDAPPLSESGLKNFGAVSWFMLVAPGGTPAGIVDKLYREVTVIIGEPQVRAEFLRLGLVPVQSPPPDELKRFVQSEIALWGDIVRQAGLAGSQ